MNDVEITLPTGNKIVSIPIPYPAFPILRVGLLADRIRSDSDQNPRILEVGTYNHIRQLEIRGYADQLRIVDTMLQIRQKLVSFKLP
jgi:hypothetical protein